MRPIIIALFILLGAMLLAFITLRDRGQIGFLNPNTPTPTPSPTPTSVPTPSNPTITINPTISPTNISLLNVLNNNNSISLFYRVIRDTGLDGVLSSGDPYTVLALENEAMQNILNSTGNNKNALNDRLKQQISYGIWDSNQVQQTITSLNGQKVGLSGGRIINTINAHNGIVHIVNTPVTPR